MGGGGVTLSIAGILGLVMLGFERCVGVGGTTPCKPPRSSCNLTCNIVLATSKGWAINTDVYFHSNSSTRVFTDWTVEGDGSFM